MAYTNPGNCHRCGKCASPWIYAHAACARHWRRPYICMHGQCAARGPSPAWSPGPRPRALGLRRGHVAAGLGVNKCGLNLNVAAPVYGHGDPEPGAWAGRSQVRARARHFYEGTFQILYSTTTTQTITIIRTDCTMLRCLWCNRLMIPGWCSPRLFYECVGRCKSAR